MGRSRQSSGEAGPSNNAGVGEEAIVIPPTPPAARSRKRKRALRAPKPQKIARSQTVSTFDLSRESSMVRDLVRSVVSRSPPRETVTRLPTESVSRHVSSLVDEVVQEVHNSRTTPEALLLDGTHANDSINEGIRGVDGFRLLVSPSLSSFTDSALTADTAVQTPAVRRRRRPTQTRVRQTRLDDFPARGPPGSRIMRVARRPTMEISDDSDDDSDYSPILTASARRRGRQAGPLASPEEPETQTVMQRLDELNSTMSTLLESTQRMNNVLQDFTETTGRLSSRIMRVAGHDATIDLTQDDAPSSRTDAMVEDEQMARRLQEEFDRELAVQLDANVTASEAALAATDAAAHAADDPRQPPAQRTAHQRQMIVRLQRMEERLTHLQRQAQQATSRRGNIGGRAQIDRMRRLDRQRQVYMHMMGGNNDEDNNMDYSSLLDLVERIGDAVPQGVPKSVVEAMPVHSYDSHNKGNETSCVICMCEYEGSNRLRHLPCKHTFHTQCIDTWMHQHHSCPICRVDVRLPQ